MSAGGEKDTAWLIRRQAVTQFQAPGIVHLDLILVSNGDPDLLAARGEFHMQGAFAWFEGFDDFQTLRVDHLNSIVVRKGEIDPDLASVRRAMTNMGCP